MANTDFMNWSLVVFTVTNTAQLATFARKEGFSLNVIMLIESCC